MKAVINLKTIEDNLKTIRSRTSARIYAVVKANAYGHGIPTAVFMQPYVDGFCVATIKEAVDLIHIAVYKPILLMGSLGMQPLLPNYKNLIYTVSSLEETQRIRAIDPGIRFYLKINTGMNRYGCSVDELSEIVDFIRLNRLFCLGVYTHFYNADEYESVSKQYKVFKSAFAFFGQNGVFHCCAGNALSLPKEFHCDIVRVGLPIYGYAEKEVGLNAAMKVSAPIVQTRRLKKGECVGYGNFRLKKDCVSAVVRAGYGDGYRRVATKTRYVCVNGHKCPIIGQVCMDAFMADVSEANAKVGDEAYLLNEVVPISDLAEEYETIAYEVLTSFNDRVERIYEYD